jgi:hypothetical protein
MKLSLETIMHATSLGFRLNWNQWNTDLINVMPPAFKA